MLCTLYLCEFSLWNRSLCETPSDGTLSPFLSRENWGAERLWLAWGHFPTHRVSYTASIIFLAWPLRHHPLWFQVSSVAAPSQYHVWLLLCAKDGPCLRTLNGSRSSWHPKRNPVLLARRAAKRSQGQKSVGGISEWRQLKKGVPWLCTWTSGQPPVSPMSYVCVGQIQRFWELNYDLSSAQISLLKSQTNP